MGDNWKHCQVGSCQRHQDCMYRPCRAQSPVPQAIPGPDMAAFQERIRAVRKARNMSLDDVASASGFTKSHVWELEKGRSSNPTVRAVWSLSKALGVSPAWLLGIDINSSPIDPLALEIAALIERRLTGKPSTVSA